MSTDPTSAPVYEIMVDGIKFAVVKGGSKLVKVPGALHSTAKIHLRILINSLTGDANAPKLTPKVAIVGDVRFYRTKNGNMYRHAAVRAQRYVTHSSDGLMLTAVKLQTVRRREQSQHSLQQIFKYWYLKLSDPLYVFETGPSPRVCASAQTVVSHD